MIAWDHWHIEVSSICTLRCPRCPRSEMPESLLNRQLSLQFFQSQLGEKVLRQIRKISFCGNDGDPIYCKDFLEIVRWIKSVNPDIHLVIVTNGSHKTTGWWQQLGLVLDKNDEINWSIDGWDQDSNLQYRINSDWDSIIQGIEAFGSTNRDTYRVWACIAFRFNQHRLGHMQELAKKINMDLWQMTKSTKFGSHYPETYGLDDPLLPDKADLVSSSHRFERQVIDLSGRDRPSAHLKQIFWQRAQDLIKQDSYSGICLIGNKGVFLNSRGELFPCCWTANRYAHNNNWHVLARERFNLQTRSCEEIMQDDFWSTEMLEFDSQECRTKCTSERLADKDHVTEW